MSLVKMYLLNGDFFFLRYIFFVLKTRILAVNNVVLSFDLLVKSIISHFCVDRHP